MAPHDEVLSIHHARVATLCPGDAISADQDNQLSSRLVFVEQPSCVEPSQKSGSFEAQKVCSNFQLPRILCSVGFKVDTR